MMATEQFTKSLDPDDLATRAQGGGESLILVPVRGFVLFPGVVLPIALDGVKAMAAAQEAVRRQVEVGFLMLRDPAAESPSALDLHRTGTVANILRYVTAPDGVNHIIAQGEQRFRVVDFTSDQPFFQAQIARLEEPSETNPDVEARFLLLQRQSIEALHLLPQAPPQLIAAVQQAPSPSVLADLVASYLDIAADEKQDLLETPDVAARIDKLLRILGHRIEVLRLSQEIGQQTKAALDERQREAVLREQLAAIQRQLGEGEAGKAQEIAEINSAIARAEMPADVDQAARKEARRLERTPEASGEYGMIRAYIDWLTELPWKLPEEQAIDLAEARRILDHDHFGLEKIKLRMLEFLAVRKLAPSGKAPILCFVGPPGVGKTSLGQSIARAMKRPFIRVSLGGVHDEAEIRGHRRTYIGALPGNIIQGVRKVGARNCVMMLDEIDKMGAGVQGDPNAAMLEALDPEQNSTFRDNYLAVPFDLSRIVFIATANTLDSIPGPLRDRMEIIGLSGYTEDEKLQIAKRYLVARQLEANGLKPEQVEIGEGVLSAIIRGYTREAGVRNLEREIGRLLRRAAVRIADGSAERVRFDLEDLPSVLGPIRFENEVAMRTSLPGVATGLAWTPVGGDILFIEATRTPGRGGFILTGQLGDVMRESAQAALSLLKNRAGAFGVDASLFEKADIHIHIPAGAIPKDGPSAGVAMFMALVSLLTGRTIRSDTAMTGEISLRGLVLPVGGIKEKVVAAAAAGITRVMLPARNRRDFEDIPDDIRTKLQFIWLERAEEAVEAALDVERAAATAVA